MADFASSNSSSTRPAEFRRLAMIREIEEEGSSQLDPISHDWRKVAHQRDWECAKLWFQSVVAASRHEGESGTLKPA
jgi:hypothetical protein